jgi:hypothetical protein
MAVPTREDKFVHAIALIESSDNWRAWSPSGVSMGRYQWEPRAWMTWQPTLVEWASNPDMLTWDQAGEFALRKFFRAALKNRPDATDVQIAMAFHLHGQVVWTGWDDNYATKFLAAEAAGGEPAPGPERIAV